MDIDLNDPELKAAIKKATDAAVAEATEGLSNKNKELLGELKAARKGQEIKPEALERLEERIEELQGDLSKAQKENKTLTKTAEEATKALESESGFTKTLLIDNGLSAELTKNGVTNAAHIKAATALLRSGVAVEIEGDTRVAKVGDKPLADYVKGWAESDEGKNFVAAPGHSGGGAPGGKGGGAAQVKGKIDGTEAERAAYFAGKHPELN